MNCNNLWLVGLLALAGCTTAPVVPASAIPEGLLDPCPIPAVQGKTNADLARALQARKQALIECNLDKAAIKDWQDGRR